MVDQRDDLAAIDLPECDGIGDSLSGLWHGHRRQKQRFARASKGFMAAMEALQSVVEKIEGELELVVIHLGRLAVAFCLVDLQQHLHHALRQHALATSQVDTDGLLFESPRQQIVERYADNVEQYKQTQSQQG